MRKLTHDQLMNLSNISAAKSHMIARVFLSVSRTSSKHFMREISLYSFVSPSNWFVFFSSLFYFFLFFCANINKGVFYQHWCVFHSMLCSHCFAVIASLFIVTGFLFSVEITFEWNYIRVKWLIEVQFNCS